MDIFLWTAFKMAMALTRWWQRTHLIPTLGWHRHKANLVYRASCRKARATKKPCLEKKKKRQCSMLLLIPYRTWGEGSVVHLRATVRIPRSHINAMQAWEPVSNSYFRRYIGALGASWLAKLAISVSSGFHWKTLKKKVKSTEGPPPTNTYTFLYKNTYKINMLIHTYLHIHTKKNWKKKRISYNIRKNLGYMTCKITCLLITNTSKARGNSVCKLAV